LCADVFVPEQDAGIFAQGVLSLTPALSLTAAARFDWVRVPFEDRYDSANSATSVFTHLSPRFGATYEFDPVWRGYAVVSGGFRAPAPVELGCASPDAPCPLPYALGSDPPLQPVTLASYEVGADWSPRGGSTLEASLFWSDVHDEIVFVASTNTQGYFQNIPHTRRAGVEVSGTLMLPRGMRASASYTFLNATYQSTVLLSSQLPVPDSVHPGDVFPLSPHDRVTFAFGATEVVGSGTIDGEIGMNAVSTQFVRGDDANVEAPLAGYAVWRLRATYARDHVAFTATVQNLFDHKFSSFATYADNPVGPPGGPPTDEVERFYTPAQPRAFIVSLKLSR
jgi:outer membrane receptor protein involved in Fe transport